MMRTARTFGCAKKYDGENIRRHIFLLILFIVQPLETAVSVRL